MVQEDSRGKVFEQKDCALCPEWMLQTLKNVYDYWCTTTIDAYYLHRNSGSLRTLTCRGGVNTRDRMVILGLSGNPSFALTYEELEGFKQAILEANREFPQISIFAVLTHVEKGTPTYTSEIHLHGKDHYTESLLGKTFLISPQAFFNLIRCRQNGCIKRLLICYSPPLVTAFWICIAVWVLSGSV